MAVYDPLGAQMAASRQGASSSQKEFIGALPSSLSLHKADMRQQNTTSLRLDTCHYQPVHGLHSVDTRGRSFERAARPRHSQCNLHDSQTIPLSSTSSTGPSLVFQYKEGGGGSVPFPRSLSLPPISHGSVHFPVSRGSSTQMSSRASTLVPPPVVHLQSFSRRPHSFHLDIGEGLSQSPPVHQTSPNRLQDHVSSSSNLSASCHGTDPASIHARPATPASARTSKTCTPCLTPRVPLDIQPCPRLPSNSGRVMRSDTMVSQPSLPEGPIIHAQELPENRQVLALGAQPRSQHSGAKSKNVDMQHIEQSLGTHRPFLTELYD